jgi:hypothetical protein
LLVEVMMLEEVRLKVLALIEVLSISCTLLYLCTSVHCGGLSEMQRNLKFIENHCGMFVTRS